MILTYKYRLKGKRATRQLRRYAWAVNQVWNFCVQTQRTRPRGIAGLGIREWECSACGEIHDRDMNAARNILALGHGR